MHHIFQSGDRYLPSTMVMRGDAIEQNFTLSCNGRELTFEPTPAYTALVREQAEQMRDQFTGTAGSRNFEGRDLP
jgi:hypothetical protein